MDSGAMMQQCIQQTLEGIDGVIVYIDDIVVSAENEEAHDMILQKVLHHLHMKDFHLQLWRCQFRKVNDLLLLSQDNICPDLANIEAMSKILMPTTLTQICSFLGIVQHYSQYIANLADMTEPLNAVLHDSKPFAWSDKCQAWFEKLKTMMATCYLPLSMITVQWRREARGVSGLWISSRNTFWVALSPSTQINMHYNRFWGVPRRWRASERPANSFGVQYRN